MKHRTPHRLPVLLAAIVVAACGDATMAPPEPTSPVVAPETPDAAVAPPVILDPGVISKRSESTQESEPSVAVAADGRVIIVWYSVVGASSRIAYRIATDDGATLGAIKELPIPADSKVSGAKPDRVYDQPRILALRSGTVLVSFHQSEATAWSIVAATSTDFEHFAPATVASGGSVSFGNFARPCASRSSGRVWLLAWEDGIGVTLRSSDDDGRSWPAERRLVVSLPEEANSTTPLQECLGGDGDVFVLYGLSKTVDVGNRNVIPKLDKLRVAHSGDGGTSVDLRVDAQDPNAGAAFMQPNFARDATGGINLTYYAGSKDADPTASYRRSRSADGGKTFAPSVVVHEPLVFETSRTGRRTPGDYMGLWSASDKLYIAYTDTSGPAGHIAFYRTSLP